MALVSQKDAGLSFLNDPDHDRLGEYDPDHLIQKQRNAQQAVSME